jgi:integrase/recombinase XerD
MMDLIIGRDGRRKYLTTAERFAMLEQASRTDPRTLTLCWVLAATGCRISEALSLSMDSIDAGSQTIVIESLKKRQRGVYRSVPVPPPLLKMLRSVHGTAGGTSTRLWPWSRMTAWRRVHEAMQSAGIQGPHATPKGLRHGFGVSAVQSGVPLNLIQRWLGHADMRTTAIYTCAVGPEELSIAARMWKRSAIFTAPARVMPIE